MISMRKLSPLATSVALTLYAPQVLSAQESPNYTIEFAQPAAIQTQTVTISGPQASVAPQAAQAAMAPASAPIQYPVANPSTYQAPAAAASASATNATSPAAPASLANVQYQGMQSQTAASNVQMNQPAAQGSLFSINSSQPMQSQSAPVATTQVSIQGSALPTQPMVSQEYEVETIDSQAAYREAANRQAVTDQIYPASVNENGTDDFYQSQTEAFNRQQSAMRSQNASQGFASNSMSDASSYQFSNASQGQFNQGAASATGATAATAATATSAVGVPVASSEATPASSSQPSFTFETPTPEKNPDDLFPLGSHAITTPDGKNIMVGPDGRPLLDANGQQIPAPAEQLQEVSVMMLTTLDNAFINAFKSLESGLTLGLGQTNYQYTVDDIAPAIRGYTFEEDGNLLVRFSVNAAQSIIKNHGALSWNGLSNPVLVWMVGLDEVNDSERLSLVSGQNLSTFAQAIINAAPDYKYRLMFPILDLEDVQKVKVSTVLAHDDLTLAEASKRYGADYFIAAAINNIDNSGSGVALKWNLYNKNGDQIAQSSLSGIVEEVASLGAGDIARAIMTYQKEQQTNPEAKASDNTPSELTSNNVDIERLGAGDGFIRIKVENVKALRDFQAIRKAFVTYGYDGDIRVVGYDDGSMILELITNSNIINLEGTIRRAGDFVYLAPWTYRFNSTSTPRRSMQGGISDGSGSGFNQSSRSASAPQQYNTSSYNNSGNLIIRGE